MEEIKKKTPILITQIEDLNEGCVKISRPYISYFPRNKPSKRVTVGPDRFIVLNSSFHSLKMVIKNVSQFFQIFLKVLELFECHRGDRYIIGTSFASLTRNYKKIVTH